MSNLKVAEKEENIAVINKLYETVVHEKWGGFAIMLFHYS